MPSTSSPRRAWKALTARRVCGPNTPSAGIPSARWTPATAAPRSPLRSIPSSEAAVAWVCADAAVCWARGASTAVAAIAKPTLRAVGRFARRLASRSRRAREPALAGGGRFPPPPRFAPPPLAGADQRPFPQLRAAEVASAGWLGHDRPAVVVYGVADAHRIRPFRAAPPLTAFGTGG